MTILVERKDTQKLIITRLILLVTVLLITFLIIQKENDYAIFFIIISSAQFFISSTDLIIYTDSIFVKKYYLCGIISYEFQIYKDSEVTITPFDISTDTGEENGGINIESLAYRFKYKDNNFKIKKLDCKLSDTEYELIKKIFKIENNQIY